MNFLPDYLIGSYWGEDEVAIALLEWMKTDNSSVLYGFKDIVTDWILAG